MSKTTKLIKVPANVPASVISEAVKKYAKGLKEAVKITTEQGVDLHKDDTEGLNVQGYLNYKKTKTVETELIYKPITIDFSRNEVETLDFDATVEGVLTVDGEEKKKEILNLSFGSFSPLNPASKRKELTTLDITSKAGHVHFQCPTGLSNEEFIHNSIITYLKTLGMSI